VIIYGVSIAIEKSAHDDWLKYMKEVHIPDVMRTKCFKKCVLSRVLEPASKPGFIVYAIQYSCASFQDYERYRNEFAARLQAEHTQRFAGKFDAAREVTEVMFEFDDAE
jgi:hypothetical protein